MTEISSFAASKTAQYASRPSSSRGRPVGSDEENDENKEDDRLFCGFAFGEDDLVHEEEDDHRDAAVEHRGADVVDEISCLYLISFICGWICIIRILFFCTIIDTGSMTILLTNVNRMIDKP